MQSGFGAGGAEKVIALISRHFAENGHSVHVTAFNEGAEQPFFGIHKDVNFSAMPPRRKQLGRIAHVRKIVRSFKPDIIISFLTKVNVITLLAMIGTSIPVIISERNNPRLQDAHPLWAHMQSLLAWRAARVVALTERGLADLQPSLTRRGVVIPNPTVPFLKTDRPIEGEARNLVAVGRLVPQKGFDLLLEAMRRIHAVCPEPTLTIYGDGRERSALEARSEALGLSAIVNFSGNTEIAGAWARNADIVISSSRFEGFHNVVGEALVSGIPVVAFDCDYGPAELIEHGRNGFLVRNGDVEGLAEATLRLIREPETRIAMAAASSELRDRLSPGRVFSAWDRLIDDVMQCS